MTVHLSARGLGCERDDRWLFADLTFSLAAGELCRVEGPNGSGKTTLLRILSGQLGDYSGELRWCGERLDRHAKALRGELLYLGHRPGVKGGLSALENLAWYQALGEYRCDDAEAARWRALERVGLAGFEELPVERLSAGQQRRVALARLHLERRALWILDEPFTAIDAAGVAQLEGWIAEHRDAGGTVLVTSHHPLALDGAMARICLDGRGGHHVIAA
ncbi:cytochrome c biogenesis heme-transporting ATPase CcmA [Halotalea alkalilenta]|uniref:cytochrome c biogenesis heme-transporting ATPase CcmA n=1 Tax=Halotalea alkalilenta TaxID=376489 RepID=UPI0005BCA50A|nr:cytochrome c biogenesis heme-transporting ATPase CcmA [Halotalea alkalilenta]